MMERSKSRICTENRGRRGGKRRTFDYKHMIDVLSREWDRGSFMLRMTDSSKSLKDISE